MCRAVDLKDLLIQLSEEDVQELKHSATLAQKSERRSLRSFIDLFAIYNEKTIKEFAAFKSEEMPELDFVKERDIELLILQNAFNAMKAGLQSVKPKGKIRLSRTPNLPIPRKYSELMRWWDMVRKKRAPQYIQKQAKEIKQKYLNKCQQVYKKYSAAFRSGEQFNQKAVVKDIERIGETTVSRAKVIVATETTRYYNQARKEVYDESEDVTHYLFVSIRDFRTTDWCKQRNGLVYAKDDPLTKKEVPPTHYNCRSEMLPLTPFNPKHKKLIDNKRLARRNNSPKPLLKGWNE